VRALIVDDSPLMRAFLSTLLPALGHEVVGEAATPEEAVAAFDKAKPGLVALDLSLEGGDGFAVLEHIRAAAPKTVVVVMTANRQKLAVDRALEAGAAGVLQKPFEAAEAKELLARLCK
jgi:DNA-binding NarL/FixJ family response regulator